MKRPGSNRQQLNQRCFMNSYAVSSDSILATGLSSWLARATLKMKGQKLSSWKKHALFPR
ncbi:hypothetical protein ACFL4I_00505 [Pseudomonadota bacterium]